MRPETRSFTTRVLLVAGIAAGTLLLLALLWYAGHVLLNVFAGLLLAVALRGLTDGVSARTGLRRGVALALVVLALLALMTGGLWALGEHVAGQAAKMVETLPTAVDHLKLTLREHAVGRFVLERLPEPQAASEQIARQAPGALALTLDVVTGVALTVFVALFVAADPDTYARGVVRLLPPSRRRRARQVLDELDDRMRRWLLGKLLTMVLIAIVTWAGLALIGVPLALALGLLAGLLNFVPYLGPALAFVPAGLLALMQGAGAAGAVAALWVGVQTLEGYVLTPLVDQKAVDVPPAVELSAIALAGVTMGAMGIVLAAPLTAIVYVLVQRLYVEDALGDDIEAPLEEPRARAA